MFASEFDSLSPSDLGDIITIIEEDTRAADYRAGIIASVMANIHAGKDSQPFYPSDFFQSLKANETKEVGPELTDDEVFSKIEAALFRS